MGNIFIPNGSFLKSSGNDNGYVVEAKNVKGLEEFIREIIGQTPPQPTTTYTVACNVTYGSKTPTGSQTVESGGSVSWTISPNSGYQMPTSVSGATISGNTITVSNVTSNKTINVVCIPSQDYYWYVGTSTTPPTESNYQTILTQVNENNNPYTYTNTNVRHYMYIIVRDTKSVLSIKDGQFDTGFEEYTNLTISGYKVYRSNSAISLNGSFVITIG